MWEVCFDVGISLCLLALLIENIDLRTVCDEHYCLGYLRYWKVYFLLYTLMIVACIVGVISLLVEIA